MEKDNKSKSERDWFESPYIIPSAEAPADFSDIGGKYKEVVDEHVQEIIDSIPDNPPSLDESEILPDIN